MASAKDGKGDASKSVYVQTDSPAAPAIATPTPLDEAEKSASIARSVPNSTQHCPDVIGIIGEKESSANRTLSLDVITAKSQFACPLIDKLETPDSRLGEANCAPSETLPMSLRKALYYLLCA